MTQTRVLSLTGICKRFDEVVALDRVDFIVRRGTIHSVLGENGAGKTTLMRIMYGLIPPDHGTVAVNGRVQRFVSPRDAIRAGIGMVHQHFSNVPSMTVDQKRIRAVRTPPTRPLSDPPEP